MFGYNLIEVIEMEDFDKMIQSYFEYHIKHNDCFRSYVEQNKDKTIEELESKCFGEKHEQVC